ncbi:MAG: hypothetical protein J7M34_03905 [Anaerolineae bacterium]|nr:hypothetical protein [Anaerolineae bacterium]
MSRPLPAVMIGGPPHAGKSTLAYHLSQALRERGVDHYVLRSAPDGEGDWSYQADSSLVRAIRVKGTFAREWVDRMCRDVAHRHLPLIVDVGGLPNTAQERIFDHCTHAVILSRNAGTRADWLALVERHNLLLIADLRSELRGQDAIESTSPVLRGIIAGLDRYHPALGMTFQALVDRLAELFAYDRWELRRLHLQQAPPGAEIVVEVERMAAAIGADPTHWRPEDLAAVLSYLPARTPLALYGRGTAWLYAAIACHAGDADLYQFDPRLGWVRSPDLALASPPRDSPLQTEVSLMDEYVRMEFVLPHHYVDYMEHEFLVMPPARDDRGVVLSGKLPLWLWTALARAYRQVPWVAVYSPQYGGAIVVCACDGSRSLGTVIPILGA